MDSKKDNDIELIEFETIVETLSALIEKGTDAVLSFFKSDAWNTALDIGEIRKKSRKAWIEQRFCIYFRCSEPE